MFIVIEGLDASGKATQSALLVERLKKELGEKKVCLFSFPHYTTSTGRIIKAMLTGQLGVSFSEESKDIWNKALSDEMAEAMILQCVMSANKYEVAGHISDYLLNDYTVVADRWTPSAECYGMADGLPAGWIFRLQQFLPEPDLCIYLDVPPEVALKRRPELRDKYEADRSKQAIVRQNYVQLWRSSRLSGLEWVTVDGRGTVDEVSDVIWQEYKRVLESRNASKKLPVGRRRISGGRKA